MRFTRWALAAGLALVPALAPVELGCASTRAAGPPARSGPATPRFAGPAAWRPHDRGPGGVPTRGLAAGIERAHDAGDLDLPEDPCADPDMLDGLDDPCYVDVPPEEVRRALSVSRRRQ